MKIYSCKVKLQNCITQYYHTKHLQKNIYNLRASEMISVVCVSATYIFLFFGVPS